MTDVKCGISAAPRHIGKAAENNMFSTQQTWFRFSAVALCSWFLFSTAFGDDNPRTILEAAIKAHGGEKNLATTLTGTLLAKAKFSLSPDMEASISWEETFELPRRYRRAIKGSGMGQNFSMEYAITEGRGWIRQNDGPTTEYKGEKQSLISSWNAILAVLPACLGKDVELKVVGKEGIEGKEAVGVSVSGESFGGKAVLFFDVKSGLLVKSKKRMEHPLTHQDAEIEGFLENYKLISGVQYPHRFTSFIDGKKILDMEITRIEFLKKLDDRLFEKP
jgi:hypothetical protein